MTVCITQLTAQFEACSMVTATPQHSIATAWRSLRALNEIEDLLNIVRVRRITLTEQYMFQQSHSDILWKTVFL